MTNALTQTWDMSHEANAFLLAGLKPAWLADRYAARTRSVAAQFAHMHNVRLAWLKHMAPESLGKLAAFERGAQPTKAQLKSALNASAKALAELFEAHADADELKSWKGPPATFLGYLVAHEAHHRGLVMVALRAAERKPPETLVYGQWDWGKPGSAR